MEKYPKILTVYKRDPATKYRTLLEGEWADPVFDYLQDNEWEFTEKVDGTNIRVGWDHEAQTVRFGGRTDKAHIPTFLFDKLQDRFPVERFRADYPDLSLTLYGEGYGAKIQKMGKDYIPDGVDFILFDVLISGNWQPGESVRDIASCLDISTVPVIDGGTLKSAVHWVQDGGFFSSLITGHIVAEGLVMRPVMELKTRTGNRVITKIKTKDFS